MCCVYMFCKMARILGASSLKSEVEPPKRESWMARSNSSRSGMSSLGK